MALKLIVLLFDFLKFYHFKFFFYNKKETSIRKKVNLGSAKKNNEQMSFEFS